MIKPMSICPTTNRNGDVVYDLMIERDEGNPVRILMAKKTINMNMEDWKQLRDLCNKVLLELEQGG